MRDTASRLKELRETEETILWHMSGGDLSPQEVKEFEDWLADTRREITRLSQYEALGYDEPNF